MAGSDAHAHHRQMKKKNLENFDRKMGLSHSVWAIRQAAN
jgi:hypothetical protein